MYYNSKYTLMRESPHGKLAKDILRYLVMGVALYLACSTPSGTRWFLKNIKKEWKKHNTRQAIERLRKQKLVSYHKKDVNEMVVTITQLGRKKVKKWDLENITIQKPKQWDRRWRIVTFDIAEERKKGRDALRTMLRRLGFYQLQRSVLVHPYSCKAEIELLRNVFALPDHEVLYFSTDRIPKEHFLKQKFGLYKK